MIYEYSGTRFMNTAQRCQKLNNKSRKKMDFKRSRWQISIFLVHLCGKITKELDLRSIAELITWQERYEIPLKHGFQVGIDVPVLVVAHAR